MIRRLRLIYDNGTASPWMRLENEMLTEDHDWVLKQMYHEIAGSKERNATSELAAEKIEKSGKAAALRVRAFHLFRQCYESKTFWVGLTADQCAEFLGESVLNVRPRVSELFKQGLLEKTGERRKNAQGSSCAVFRLV